jgi:hypothetical protein
LIIVVSQTQINRTPPPKQNKKNLTKKKQNKKLGIEKIENRNGTERNGTQVEGLLKVKEHAGRGTMTTMVCGETVTLWSKDVDEWPCPSVLPFSIALPTAFSDERGSWVCDSSSFLLPCPVGSTVVD